MNDGPKRIWIDKKNIPHSDVYAGTYYLDDDEEHETIAYTLKDIADELAEALEWVSNTFDNSWNPLSMERMAGDKARAALARYRETET